MLDVQALKAQLKELDEEISVTEAKLAELKSLRASFGGMPPERPPIPQETPEPRSAIVMPDSPENAPQRSWTREQQQLMDMEAERIRQLSPRFNQNMNPPVGRVKQQSIQVPKGVTIPTDMQSWLES